MMIIIGIIFIILGLVMFIKPFKLWKIVNTYKYKSLIEPSKGYLMYIRITGIIIIVIGISLIFKTK